MWQSEIPRRIVETGKRGMEHGALELYICCSYRRTILSLTFFRLASALRFESHFLSSFICNCIFKCLHLQCIFIACIKNWQSLLWPCWAVWGKHDDNWIPYILVRHTPVCYPGSPVNFAQCFNPSWLWLEQGIPQLA